MSLHEIFTIQIVNIESNVNIKKSGKCKDDGTEWCEICEACKKLWVIVKNVTTQPANIASQDFPRTSPPTFPKRSLKILFNHSRDVPNQTLRDVPWKTF